MADTVSMALAELVRKAEQNGDIRTDRLRRLPSERRARRSQVVVHIAT